MDVPEGGERLLGGIRVRRLGIVDEQHVAAPPDLLHPVRQAGERGQSGLDLLAREPQRPGHRHGNGRVLPVVGAPQRTDAVDVGERRPSVSRTIPSRTVSASVQSTSPWGTCDAHEVGAAPVGDGPARRIVDADHREGRSADQALLDGRVLLHGAVTVEMVRRDVHQHADARIEARRQVDLERRHLDHVDALGGGRLAGTGSRSRYCRPSARRGPPGRGRGRSAPWWSTCRWSR